MNGILEMSWFVHIFLQIKHIVPIVIALLHSYLDSYVVYIFSHVNAQTVLWWF